MARWLSWNEITELPRYEPVWIQYGTHTLEYDTLNYDAENNIVQQDYALSVYNEPDKSYRRSWVVWDTLPTKEEFFRNDWRLH